MHHSAIGNDKREGLKSARIGQSAAKHLIVKYDMMKVQRLAERRTLKRGEMRGKHEEISRGKVFQ